MIIDLTKFGEEPECRAECDYLYHPGNKLHSPDNDGTIPLRVLASFAVFCRRCEQASCINVCPTEALEKGDDGIVHRANMRCVGCKSCALACPFGTALPVHLPYRVSACDYHIKVGAGKTPRCVETCKSGHLSFEEVEEDPKKNLFFVGEHLAVRAPSFWQLKVAP